eukprot:scaffold10478_cov114-Isochrysis_galbana.AAC.7
MRAAHQAVKGLLLGVVAREGAAIRSKNHSTACDGTQRVSGTPRNWPLHPACARRPPAPAPCSRAARLLS